MNLSIFGVDMSTLNNLPLPSSVEALVLTNPEPMWLSGHAKQEGDSIVVEFAELPLPVDDGVKVILNFPLEQSPMVTLVINTRSANSLVLEATKIHPRDKRTFPRHFGNIPLAYRTITIEEEELVQRQWMQKIIEMKDDFHQPEPFMNFSVGGLSFEDNKPAAVGRLALIEFGVGSSDERWRATARVVRCQLLEDNTTYEIAIRFEQLPDAAMDALSKLTISIQEAML